MEESLKDAVKMSSVSGVPSERTFIIRDTAQHRGGGALTLFSVLSALASMDKEVTLRRTALRQCSDRALVLKYYKD